MGRQALPPHVHVLHGNPTVIRGASARRRTSSAPGRRRQTAESIDVSHIELDFGKTIDDLGHPPPLEKDLRSLAQSAAIVAMTVVFEADVPLDLIRQVIRRGAGEPQPP